jgi:hypothetical protein
VALSKVKEKRENLSLRKLRKPGKIEREIILLLFLKFSIQKGRNFSLRKLRKLGEREKEKVVLLFSSTLALRICTLGRIPR